MMKILFHFVYDQTSMQNFSAINFTICGGRTLFREVNPIRESSSRYGLHHRMSVVTDTPALKANSDLDIAFIKSYIIYIARPEGAQALRAIPKP